MRILFLLLICVHSFAANRLANSTDVSTFAATYPTEYAMYLREPSKHPLMTLNDIIIDTRTSVPNNTLVINNIASMFSGARFGFTVWISATMTGSPLKYINFANNSVMWTGTGDSDHPIRFRTLGGQLVVRHTSTNPNNSTFRLADLEYYDLNFERDDYPGLRDSWGANRKGTFGMRADGEGDQVPGTQMFTIE